MPVPWIGPERNAQFHAVDERIVGRKPSSLSWTEAAAMPLTSITAWELLFDRMRVPYGEKTGGGTLLIINGSGRCWLHPDATGTATHGTYRRRIGLASRDDRMVQKDGRPLHGRPSQTARCGNEAHRD